MRGPIVISPHDSPEIPAIGAIARALNGGISSVQCMHGCMKPCTGTIQPLSSAACRGSQITRDWGTESSRTVRNSGEPKKKKRLLGAMPEDGLLAPQCRPEKPHMAISHPALWLTP